MEPRHDYRNNASKDHFATMIGVLGGLDLNRQPAIELPNLSEEEFRPPAIDDSDEDERAV
jgi:hypothetical protein